MCGIVGYVGRENAREIIIDGLKRLEYRGYDSAGIAVVQNGKILLRKHVGEIANLENFIGDDPMTSGTGIGHTRWATHGVPSDLNAHPHLNGDGTIALQMNTPTLPQQPFAEKPVRTLFKDGKLGTEWVYIRNYHPENYTFSSGKLRLKATPVSLDNGKESPTFVGRRQEDIDFTATTSLQLQKASTGDEAGLTVYMFEPAHYDLFVKQLEGGKQAVVLRYRLGAMTHIEKEVTLPQGKVQLRVKGNKDLYSFEYATDGASFKELGRMNACYISTETAGGFTGIMLGMYASSSSEASKAYAEVEYFDYEK